jgi:glycosyltransferase involved in cell wall biosynthesis
LTDAAASAPFGSTASDISLVICTYNRADLLARALESACRQAVHPSRYEILVVDNNSTDHTRDVVARFQRDQDNVRYLHETRVGLSHARNRGWQEARAPYVAYTDDDCILPPHWLAVALEIVQTKHPEAFGGPFRALYFSRKPAWYKDSYGSGGYGAIPRHLRANEQLAGNNMVFRKATLQLLGGFDPRHGMIGKSVGYGEDTEIQIRLRNVSAQAEIWYDPRVELLHLVRPEQMTLGWITRAAIAKGRYHYWISNPPVPVGFAENLSQIASLLKGLAVVTAESVSGLVYRDRNRYPDYRNYLCERVLWRLSRVGRFQGYRDHRAQRHDQTTISEFVRDGR